MVIDPTPETNPATEGIARMCGASATPLLTLATLGVSLAMATAVALVVTKRPDVARMAGLGNIAMALWVLWIAGNAGSGCVPIGAMAASLPLLVGIGSLAVSFLQFRKEEQRRKNGGHQANSG